MIRETDSVVLLDLTDGEKKYFVPVSRGRFSTRHGEIDLAALVGSEYGRVITTHLGAPFAVLKPTTHDFIMLGLRRQTQIVYPKDAGFLVLWLGLCDGARVFECGAGSGAMTVVMAKAVAPNGKVVSYERDERFFKLAAKNVERAGVAPFVELHHADLSEGVEGAPFDAAFIDVREPWLYIDVVWDILGGGCPAAFVMPTTNQITALLAEFEKNPRFADVQVAEIALRFYKPVSERLRPKDRMVAHTAYIVLARKITPDD